MQAHVLRRAYIEFFKERGHLHLPGAPLIPIDVLGHLDESTLFTGSGMQQFKPYFAGVATPPSRRITTVQKCVRTGDIDSVGDYSHCTFFEMLGNFSFGDYFKAEVIPWTWEFLTQVVGLEPERLCATVYKDDEESYSIWHEKIGLPADRIHRLDEDKNFWPANVLSEGPDGPCGPCSEVYYRLVPVEELTADPQLTPTQRFLKDEAEGRWLEIWNNVFTQYNRSTDTDGKPILTPLPQKNNDTGAGLDRIAYIAQGKRSVFETDLFGPTLEAIEKLAGVRYEGSMSPTDFAFRVVAEHTRCMVFCIADGILPSNEGRGYVLRYIMRRAVRYGKMALGFDAPFLHEVAPHVIAQMRDFYPELEERQALILQTIRTEEEQFRRTLDRGMRILTEMLHSVEVQATKRLPGHDVFRLYDTYGFPLRLTQELAAEAGVEVDLEGFEAELETQRVRSQQSSKIDREVFSASVLKGVIGADLPPTEFLGYHTLQAVAKVLAIYVGERPVEFARAGEKVTVVLDRTPFYAEAGGQVGDTGTLVAPEGETTCALRAEVCDTQKNPLGVYLHSVIVQEGELRVGQKVHATVDRMRRLDIMRNHTATHLLQAALRQVLGTHVYQKGSLVAPDRLRFDFTHTAPLTPDELRQVEELVNAEVLNDVELEVHWDVPLEEAKARGAMALFGEKYGERVRVIEIPGFSLELCGGTHLQRTSQVGLFRIVSETGIASGVRRIEAVTGRAAWEYTRRREQTIEQLTTLLRTRVEELPAAVERLMREKEDLEKRNRQLLLEQSIARLDTLEPTLVDGIPVLATTLEEVDAKTLGDLVERIAKRLKTAIVVLGTVVEGKGLVAAKVTTDLVQQGYHAGNLVREVAKIMGGGGGGRADFATAGGRDSSKLSEALKAVPDLVRAQKTQKP